MSLQVVSAAVDAALAERHLAPGVASEVTSRTPKGVGKVISQQEWQQLQKLDQMIQRGEVHADPSSAARIHLAVEAGPDGALTRLKYAGLGVLQWGVVAALGASAISAASVALYVKYGLDGNPHGMADLAAIVMGMLATGISTGGAALVGAVRGYTRD